MRVAFFVSLFVISLTAPYWFFLLCCIGYALYWSGYELIVIGVLVDAQFGIGVAAFPYLYTMSAGVIVLLAEAGKPFLSFYNT